QASLPDLYASADAFVFPSTSETQGLVQAEALAAGAYVIAADSQTNRDVLGGAARVVAPRREAFGQALREIPVAPDLERSARAKVAARRFAATAQVDRIIDLYTSLLEPTPRPGIGERTA
ncbi:MAG TPA: glycosyltransferase, partial [Candidatus Aquilonibacter sp.]